MSVTVTYRERKHFPLADAVLCIGCDEVLESPGTCPVCTGTIFMPLEQITGSTR